MSEWHVRTSRRINRLLGDTSGVMLCTRVYVNARLWGSGWIVAEITINALFKLREKQHVRRTYLWERRYAQAYQKTVTSTQETPRTEQTGAT